MTEPRTELSDILTHGLKVIIVGFNPSLVSWASGHHYANPVNQFYRLLFRAGLAPRLLSPAEDELLPQFGIGLTNFVINSPSAHENALPASVYRASRAALDEKIQRYQPRMVSFNGLRLYDYYFGRKLPSWGLQAETVAGRPLFVTPSSSGAANQYFQERQKLYDELKTILDKS